VGGPLRSGSPGAARGPGRAGRSTPRRGGTLARRGPTTHRPARRRAGGHDGLARGTPPARAPAARAPAQGPENRSAPRPGAPADAGWGWLGAESPPAGRGTQSRVRLSGLGGALPRQRRRDPATPATVPRVLRGPSAGYRPGSGVRQGRIPAVARTSWGAGSWNRWGPRHGAALAGRGVAREGTGA